MICRSQAVDLGIFGWRWSGGGCAPIWTYALVLGGVLAAALASRWAINRWWP